MHRGVHVSMEDVQLFRILSRGVSASSTRISAAVVNLVDTIIHGSILRLSYEI